jgi:hypothetical protein
MIKELIRPIDQEWKKRADQSFNDTLQDPMHTAAVFTQWYIDYIAQYWNSGMAAEHAGKRAAEAYNRKNEFSLFKTN